MMDSSITTSNESISRKTYDSCACCNAFRKDYPDRKYFSFPKNGDRSKKWIEACNLTSLLHVDAKTLNENYKICSKHFRPEDYVKERMIRLTQSAVPSLFLDENDDIFSMNLKQLKAKLQGTELMKVSSNTPVQAIDTPESEVDIMPSTSKSQTKDVSEEAIEETEDTETPDTLEQSSHPKFRTTSVCVKMKFDDIKESEENEEQTFIVVHEMYQCGNCSKLFGEESSLSNHECILPDDIILTNKLECKLNSKTYKYDCDKCDLSFTQKKTLIKHSQVHKTKPNPHKTKPNPLVCHPCGLDFLDKDSLLEHRKNHYKEKWFKCDQCDKRFAYEKLLNWHVRRQHLTPKPPPPQCDICDKIFRHRHNVARHKKAVHNLIDKPFVCVICNASFRLKEYLKSHSLSHTGEKPFLCEKCGKGFKNKWLLKKHSKSHELKQFKPGQYYGQRIFKPKHTYKFVCDKCGKRFSTIYSLKTHSYLHTGEKPFKCDICTKGFRFKQLLKNHLFMHGNRKLTCKVCDKNFTCLNAYTRHLIIHNDAKAIACDACDMKFTTRWHLNSHYVVHTKEKPYECDLCHKRYSQKGTLKKHPCSQTAVQSFESNLAAETLLNLISS